MNALPMTEQDPQPPALPRPLSNRDARRVSDLLDAAGAEYPELETVLTDPDVDVLIDRFLRDEVHSPRA